MTDQSNSPASPKGRSLIERAVTRFEIGDLAAPPIPADVLRAVPLRKELRKVPVTAAVIEPVQDAVLELPKLHVASVVAPAAVNVARPVHKFTAPAYPVDRDHLRDQGLIVPEGSVTQLLEEFRIVKRQLLGSVGELRETMPQAAQRILICSPHPGEGKTYTSVNLALSLAAEKECEVLLVDADFAKPSVLSALGLPGGKGLMDALADPSIDVRDLVIGTDIPGLWVLPAGDATNSDSEFLSSSRTATVLDRLIEDAPNRIVIFDSPPALAASPAAELAKYVGQSVLVVRADRTGQGALEDAVSLLSACPNIELLLNAVHFSPSGRRFGSYYGYGG